MSATTSGTLDLSQYKFLDEDIPLDSSCRCHRGDIYLQRGNTKELVGTAALFNVEEPNYVYPDLMIRIRADESKILSEFLLHILQSSSSRDFMSRNSVGSAGSMPKINQGIVEKIPIPLPPIVIQKEIVAEIENLEASINTAQELIDSYDQKIKSKIAEVWET